jgi:7-cyano-7-deazaguanine synthase
MTRSAVVLVSGGLDSATCLAIARSEGFDCYALSIDYGQRHQFELKAAANVVKSIGAEEHKILHLDLAGFSGSALTDPTVAVPHQASEGIPVTYVPARNTIFMSLALGWAEVMNIQNIFIGVNAVDYSGYPDCRPEFITAFERMAALATKQGVEGNPFKFNTPLIDLSKADIIKKGVALNVDYGLTISCYDPDDAGRACGCCDSCRLRAAGFLEAKVKDPTIYQV